MYIYTNLNIYMYTYAHIKYINIYMCTHIHIRTQKHTHILCLHLGYDLRIETFREPPSV